MRTRIGYLLVLGASLNWVTACSMLEKKAAEEPVAADTEGEEEMLETDDSASTTAEANQATNEAATLPNTLANGENGEGNATNGATENGTTQNAGNEAAGVANSAPVPSGRVVRFIKADHTPIYAAAQSTGQPVTTMWQGDPVVVLMQDHDWAQINASHFVLNNALSESIVPRTRDYNKWIVSKTH